MRRQPQPRYHTQKRWWYVYLDGKQIRLSGKVERKSKTDPPPEEVLCEYHKLMARRQGEKPAADAPAETPAADAPESPLVLELVNEFLDWCDRHRPEGTYAWYQRHLVTVLPKSGRKRKSKTVPFADWCGPNVRVSDLTPEHLENWLEQVAGGDNNRNGAARAVKRVFAWAIKKRKHRLTVNPVAGAEIPQAHAREDAYLEPEDFDRFIAAVKSDALRDIATFLRQTGCRPAEARTLEARHLDRAARCIVFKRKESKGKRDGRIIPLSAAAFEIVSRLALKHGADGGPLFRTASGKPWRASSLAHEFKKVGDELGIKVTPYSLRHTFATDALANDVDPISVANLLGHKSLDMLMKVYARLQKKSDHLRAKLHQALGQTG